MLGHEVIGYAIEVREAVGRIAAEDPDVAVAVLHGDTQHALDLIDELSEVARGPLEIAVRRHAERERLEEQVDQLEGALARHAVIERAKGILMERHDPGERAAFERVRTCARSHQRTVVSVAEAVAVGDLALDE